MQPGSGIQFYQAVQVFLGLKSLWTEVSLKYLSKLTVSTLLLYHDLALQTALRLHCKPFFKSLFGRKKGTFTS